MRGPFNLACNSSPQDLLLSEQLAQSLSSNLITRNKISLQGRLSLDSLYCWNDINTLILINLKGVQKNQSFRSVLIIVGKEQSFKN